jgi:hypothetical protein
MVNLDMLLLNEHSFALLIEVVLDVKPSRLRPQNRGPKSKILVETPTRGNL